jgi:hypothetical protein
MVSTAGTSQHTCHTAREDTVRNQTPAQMPTVAIVPLNSLQVDQPSPARNAACKSTAVGGDLGH